MKAYTLLIIILTYTISLAQWTDNQDAEYVIGQPDFTTYSSGSTLQKLNSVGQCVIDYTNHKLYVVDAYNTRVLRFSYPITSNNPTAEMYFVTGALDVALGQYGNPSGVAVYNGTLWICDFSHHRILKFNNAYSASNAPNPDGVLGQTNYEFPSFPGSSQSQLYSPSKICIDNNGNLWVADANNNRILKFNDVNNKANGANADLVLGQTDFTSNGHSTSRNTLYAPNDVFVYGTTVWVADNANQRVLWYNNPTTNGTNADGVLGQINFTTGALQALSNSTFFNPTGISVDNSGRLYVADINRNRIMIFNDAANKSNGAAANNVLGQSTFNTSASNKGQNGFYSPNSVIVDLVNNKLLVSDNLDNRIMQFSASSALPVELITFTAAINTVGTRRGVFLQWETASEVNNYGFEVERSEVGSQRSEVGDQRSEWITIGFVQGNGNSNSPKEYSFVDENPPTGNLNYRLKQIDTDGKFEYYRTIAEVNLTTGVEEKGLPKEFALLQNYPNPFNPVTSIEYRVVSPSAGQAGIENVVLKVYDVLGNEVATLVNEHKQPGEYRVEFDGSNISSGIYMYQLRCGSFVDTKKFILMK